MPGTDTHVPPSKPRRRLKPRREKKRKFSPSEAVKLSIDAEIGTFLVDKVAEELLDSGASDIDKVELIRSIREKVSMAGGRAVLAEVDHQLHGPRRLSSTKRFFRDLSQIQTLIKRNADLDPLAVARSTKRVGRRSLSDLNRQAGDECRDLQAALERAKDAITSYQAIFKPQGRPGNHDPLMRTFIDELAELWCHCVWVERSRHEFRLFVRLLAAGWQDMHFRTKDFFGQGLEEWFADRVRKQFPYGISSYRIERQREMLYELCCSPRTSGHGHELPRAAINSRGERYPSALCR